MPSISSAPIMTAVVPEPGTPSASIGMSAPTEAALFADSGAATPSTAPLPKSSGCLDSCFCVLYAMMLAMVPPAPGRTPVIKPSGELRKMAPALRFQSSFVIQMRPNLVCIFFLPSEMFLKLLRTSPSANTAMMTIRKSMPPCSSMTPNVKRSTPD